MQPTTDRTDPDCAHRHGDAGVRMDRACDTVPPRLLRELLLLQHETDMSDGNLLDAVGEIANTLGGNARKTLGSGLQISVPVKLQGSAATRARVRRLPYVITLRWNHQPAMVCVDMEKK